MHRAILCPQEAGYCCRGSDGCGAVMRLPGQAQDELWAAVNRGDGAAARHIMAQLRLNPTPVSKQPLRMYAYCGYCLAAG